MTGTQLEEARLGKGWTQQRVAARLRVSQPYLSLLEQGQRRVPEKLALKAAVLLDMSAENLPLVKAAVADEESLVHDLAALGYPGFAYLRQTKMRNPAQVLLLALCKNELPSRVTES